MATLAEARVRRADVVLPTRGVWHADVWLDTPEALSGPATLVLGGLTLRGTILTGDAYQGAADYRVVGGAGGWRKELPPQAYRLESGLQLSLVAGDAATAVGETIAFQSGADVLLGPAYARFRGAASDVLDLLADEWWVDPAGVTQIGPRPGGAVTGVFEVTHYDPTNRVATVATETPEDLVVGYTVDLSGAPSMTIGQIVHHLEEGGLRTELWAADGSGDVGRLTQMLRGIVRKFTASVPYGTVYEYRVVSQSGDRVDLQPVRRSDYLPDLPKVPMRPGIAGARATLAGGASVVVAFLDGDPTRPTILSYTAPDDAAADPSLIQLCDQTSSVAVGTETGRVVRFGDVIMMPVGTAGTPTATAILGAKLGDVGAPVGPVVVSRVKA